MKIDYIKTQGFRKSSKIFETKLYDITEITGKNRSGKSNILFAIVNILFGTNLSGNEKACLINHKCDSSLGELHFRDSNNVKHILVRGKDRYKNSGNFISLDGKIIKETDLVNFYKDKKLALSIMNPMYFLMKKPAEQKEMVDRCLSDIKPKQIFDRLNKNQQNALLQKYYNDSKKYEELTPEEQTNFVNQNMFNICMDVAFNNLDKNEQTLLEGIPNNIPLYITDMNSDIKRLETLNSSLDGKIEYAQNIASEKLENRKTFEKETELNLARQELAFLNSNQVIIEKEKQEETVQKLQKDVLNKQNEIKALTKIMTDGKAKYYEIKNSKDALCPTCGQHILDKHKENALLTMYKELMDKFDKRNVLETELNELQISLSKEEAKYYELDAETDTSVKNSNRVSVLEQNIKELEQEQSAIEQFNNGIDIKEKNIKIAKQDIANFNQAKQNHNKLIDNLKDTKKVAQKLYISYIEEQMKIAKDYLKNVNIKFYSVLKTTGEIKEDFIITYQNRPLADLSRSETIATSLEFANMFNKISKMNLPIFIDDYESCADYDFIKEYSNDTQIITSTVKKRSPLKIANFANHNEYTIVKQNIKGYKTIKGLNKHSKHIQKAA